jgi:hypothetical protein
MLHGHSNSNFAETGIQMIIVCHIHVSGARNTRGTHHGHEVGIDEISLPSGRDEVEMRSVAQRRTADQTATERRDDRGTQKVAMADSL